MPACAYRVRRARWPAKPLQTDVLAGLQAEYEAAFHLTFYLVELIGREEAGEIDDAGRCAPTPAYLGGQADHGTPGGCRGIGGCRVVRRRRLRRGHRRARPCCAIARYFPIWEGTTNVLSLDAMKAREQPGTMSALKARIDRTVAAARSAASQTQRARGAARGGACRKLAARGQSLGPECRRGRGAALCADVGPLARAGAAGRARTVVARQRTRRSACRCGPPLSCMPGWI